MKKSLAVLFIVILCVGFVNAQSKTSFDLHMTVIAPIGQFNKAYKLGFGGDAGFLYKIAPNFDLTFGLGYYKSKDKTDGDFTLSSVPLYVGARCYPFNILENGPYVTAEVGIQSLSWDKKDSTLYNTIYLFSKKTLYQADFSYGAGIGYVEQVADKINIDIFGKYNSILIEGSYPKNYLSFGLGFIFNW